MAVEILWRKKELMMSTGKDVCSQLYVIQERLLQAPDYMSTLASRHSSMVNLRSCLAANDSSSSLTRLALDLTGQSARVRGSGAREEAGMAGGAPGQGEPACVPVHMQINSRACGGHSGCFAHDSGDQRVTNPLPADRKLFVNNFGIDPEVSWTSRNLSVGEETSVLWLPMVLI
ncbi:hypothetical protein C0Q70_10971 [Pomacea canaliculata]|uniref:Uncharacterized protein n=1 Tax=Pomacea canaliculata TaxID=400727 RepID=A0A2T7P4N5_POMCA|nr:hypothetical protein C0Q70_10971 [Pomacea canaliculata]